MLTNKRRKNVNSDLEAIDPAFKKKYEHLSPKEFLNKMNNRYSNANSGEGTASNSVYSSRILKVKGPTQRSNVLKGKMVAHEMKRQKYDARQQENFYKRFGSIYQDVTYAKNHPNKTVIRKSIDLDTFEPRHTRNDFQLRDSQYSNTMAD